MSMQRQQLSHFIECGSVTDSIKEVLSVVLSNSVSFLFVPFTKLNPKNTTTTNSNKKETTFQYNLIISSRLNIRQNVYMKNVMERMKVVCLKSRVIL